MITKEQLKSGIDRLEDNQVLELINQIINQNLKQTLFNENAIKTHNKAEQEKAMAEFFGMHKELGIDTVEEELRCIRDLREHRCYSQPFRCKTMIDISTLHLQYLTNQQGEQTAVVMPIQEFTELMEYFEDLITVTARKNEATTSHDDFLIELTNIRTDRLI